MKLFKKLLIALLLVGGILFSSTIVVKGEFYDLEGIIEGAINWKKTEVGATPSETLFNNEFLSLAGTTPGDWFPIGIGRYNYYDEYYRYLAAVTEQVNLRYLKPEKLDKAKATEWHRIALAITAMGGDPTKVGQYNNEPINLIADGTYNRGYVNSPGRQGINGWIWGLITLDSKNYEVPTDAYNTRQDFIIEIIKNQLADGGFALYGQIADPDISAMVIQALAPYYNSEVIYSYQSTKLKDSDGSFLQVTKTVKEVIDEGLLLLSNIQSEDGDYYSWGMANAESTVQVLVALTSLGINPLEDERFIKNNNNLLDGILKYKLDNGGFLHSFVYDPDNPSSKPDEANSMATEQVLYGLVAYNRLLKNERRLYDMQSEFSLVEKEEITTLIREISKLNNNSSKIEVDEVLKLYYQLSSSNRSYIHNYWTLSDYAKKYDLKLPDEDIIFTGKANDGEMVILYFSESDKQKTIALPLDETLTTNYYQEVVNLRYILEKSEEFENKEIYKIKLDKVYNQIALIQAEIDDINNSILENLHPFNKIGLKDKKLVFDLVDRYNSLHEDDKSKIVYFEDLLKSKTKITNIQTSIKISIILSSIAVLLTVTLTFSIIYRRKQKKLKLMPESDE